MGCLKICYFKDIFFHFIILFPWLLLSRVLVLSFNSFCVLKISFNFLSFFYLMYSSFFCRLSSTLLSSSRFSICRSLPISPLRVVSFGSGKTIGKQHLHRRFFNSMSDDVGVQVDKVNAVPNSVHVRVAHDLLLAGHRYLDVRLVDATYGGLNNFGLWIVTTIRYFLHVGLQKSSIEDTQLGR